MSIKSNLATWVEEQLEFCCYDLKNLKPPYSAGDLLLIQKHKPTVVLLFELMRNFDISISKEVYDSYRKFLTI